MKFFVSDKCNTRFVSKGNRALASSLLNENKRISLSTSNDKAGSDASDEEKEISKMMKVLKGCLMSGQITNKPTFFIFASSYISQCLVSRQISLRMDFSVSGWSMIVT